jgi:glycerol-3-phosphate acyltransferase PlsY
MLVTVLLSVIAYLIGSISSAIIVCRLSGLPDPRSQGSKNPGATNVLRLGGKRLAAITLLGDALKGFIPVMITMNINASPATVAPVMLAAFLGHLYPLFFGFKGGKGVATAIGTLFGLSWVAGLLWVVTWLVMAFLFRLSSLAALTAAILAPIYVTLSINIFYAIPVAMMSFLLIWRHRENIHRIVQGTEPKIGQKKS